MRFGFLGSFLVLIKLLVIGKHAARALLTVIVIGARHALHAGRVLRLFLQLAIVVNYGVRAVPRPFTIVNLLDDLTGLRKALEDPSSLPW